MKVKGKLLVLALLLTALALAPAPPASASILCPPVSCFDVTQDCVDSGGAPIPQATGETCYTLPTHDEYIVNIVYCYYPSTQTTTFDECYLG
jgi:hypothetical protein